MKALLLIACLAAFLSSGQESRAALPPLRVAGPNLVDPSGQTVLLRGCNLGNWFLFEAWMMDLARPGEPRDHVGFLRTLETRFGPRRASELLDLFRENWLRARDFELMREFGFNAVRVPFHYALLEDPAQPGELRADAFRWLDHAVKLASDAGLYVILDMHGAPGAQSIDHVTGETGRNEFWLPENRLRGAKLWEAIARRYRDHPAVVAYDLLNEPYGKLAMDNDDAQLVGAMEELVAAVRSSDPDKLIYLAGALRGVEVYGPPSARGWRNVGFTEHFYPGFYGDETSLATQALFLNAKVPQRAALLRAWNAPYLVGEFNPVVKDNGGPAMLRRYFDAFAAQGWAATMWSYKLLKRAPGAEPEPWYLVTNATALDIPSFARASDTELETFSAPSAPWITRSPSRNSPPSARPSRPRPCRSPPPANSPRPTPAPPRPRAGPCSTSATPTRAPPCASPAPTRSRSGAADAISLALAMSSPCSPERSPATSPSPPPWPTTASPTAMPKPDSCFARARRMTRPSFRWRCSPAAAASSAAATTRAARSRSASCSSAPSPNASPSNAGATPSPPRPKRRSQKSSAPNARSLRRCAPPPACSAPTFSATTAPFPAK